MPYSGKQGKKIVTKMKKYDRKTLRENIQTIVIYQIKKLSTNLHVKDKTKFYYQSNLVSYGKYPNQTYTEDYIEESDCRIKDRIIDRNKRDKNSHILKHSREEGHSNVWDKNLKVLGSIYRSAFKRKISEALKQLKQLKPSINVKEKSIQLHFHNATYDATHLRF